MEKIRINEKNYEISDIRYVSDILLCISFTGEIPESYGTIQVFTEGDVKAAELKGYMTVYKQEGQTIWLSNDGSVYQEPKETPIISENPYITTLDDVKAMKLTEVNSVCQSVIKAGVDVSFSGEVEHFSLTETDQLNLFGLQAMIAAGQKQIPYHADGCPCRFYSVEEITKVIQSAMLHASYHTTYVNALHLWINDCQSIEDVEQIQYGAEVPTVYQSDVLKSYIAQIAGATK